MKLGMTKALYNIKKTFPEMIELHKTEIENHQRLIDNFKDSANKTKNVEEKLVYLLESARNKEHQTSHKRMVTIYRFLSENL